MRHGRLVAVSLRKALALLWLLSYRSSSELVQRIQFNLANRGAHTVERTVERIQCTGSPYRRGPLRLRTACWPGCLKTGNVS